MELTPDNWEESGFGGGILYRSFPFNESFLSRPSERDRSDRRCSSRPHKQIDKQRSRITTEQRYILPSQRLFNERSQRLNRDERLSDNSLFRLLARRIYYQRAGQIASGYDHA